MNKKVADLSARETLLTKKLQMAFEDVQEKHDEIKALKDEIRKLQAGASTVLELLCLTKHHILYSYAHDSFTFMRVTAFSLNEERECIRLEVEATNGAKFFLNLTGTPRTEDGDVYMLEGTSTENQYLLLPYYHSLPRYLDKTIEHIKNFCFKKDEKS